MIRGSAYTNKRTLLLFISFQRGLWLKFFFLISPEATGVDVDEYFVFLCYAFSKVYWDIFLSYIVCDHALVLLFANWVSRYFFSTLLQKRYFFSTCLLSLITCAPFSHVCYKSVRWNVKRSKNVFIYLIINPSIFVYIVYRLLDKEVSWLLEKEIKTQTQYLCLFLARFDRLTARSARQILVNFFN